MSQRAIRLKQLRAEGMTFSRNRHFDFFERPENRAALQLERELKMWRNLILAVEGKDLCALHRDGSTHVVLTIATEEVSAKRQRRFSGEEFELLCGCDDVVDVLLRHDVGGRSETILASYGLNGGLGEQGSEPPPVD